MPTNTSRSYGREYEPINVDETPPPMLRPTAVPGIDIGELPDYQPFGNKVALARAFAPTVPGWLG